MKNIQVVEKFVNGATSGRSSNGNLYIQGDKLVNYSTVIAYRPSSAVTSQIFLNKDKYSQTTSRIQGMVRRETPANWLEEVTHNELMNRIADLEMSGLDK